jgi:single-stranded DNA-specific DHH superfamily exonuclease
MSGEWPADAEAIRAGQQFVNDCRGRVVVTAHNDVDGLSAAVIVTRALSTRGVEVETLPARRGEHVHQDVMRARLASLSPDALVVLDMGMRAGPIVEGIPTLVIDHHDGVAGRPSGAVVVNGFDREPVAPSSVLAFVVCRHIPELERAAWLAALGAVADLGTAAPFAGLLGIEPRGAAWARAAALLNAGRRAPEDDAATALRVLSRAGSVHEIAAGRVPGVDRLQEHRKVVQAEVDRCSRVAPQMMGDAALIRCSSAAQVHPIVATRWSGRLAPAVVIAANDGFLSGRVNFAVRSRSDTNLLEWLRGLSFTPAPGSEYGNGHPRATGGSVTPEEFERFLAAVRDRASRGE